jgi:hypothetical protein
MIKLTKFGMLLAIVALTSIVAIAISTTVSAQNMTGNMTGAESEQNMTADINQTGSISGGQSSDNRELYISDYSPGR